jgi:hypothetical protein
MTTKLSPFWPNLKYFRSYLQQKQHKGYRERHNLSLAIFAFVSALSIARTTAPAPAAEAIQDRYCLQGANPVIPEIMSSRPVSSAKPLRAAQMKAAGLTQ